MHTWRPAKASLALAIAGVIACVSGCKRASEQADLSVSQALLDSDVEMQKASGKASASAVSFFQKAAAVPNAPDATRAQTQKLLARANVRAADPPMLLAEAKDVQTEALIGALSRQADRLQRNNDLVESLKKLEPVTVRDTLAKQLASAKGAGEAPWVAGDAGPVPSVSIVQQKIKALNTQIDQLTTQKNDLQVKRAQQLQQADQLRAQSEAASGKKSLDLYVQSANLVKEASDLAIQSDSLDAQINAQQQQLAVAQAQDKQLSSALDSLNKQGEGINSGWQTIQKLIDQISASSTALLSGGSSTTAPDASAAAPASTPDATTPTAAASGAAASGASTAPAAASSSDDSISALLAQIDKSRADAGASRTEAEKRLTEALTALKTAASASAAVVKNYSADANDPKLRTLPQAEAWQTLIDIYNPSDIKLETALIDLRLARLYADAAVVAHRLQLVGDRASKALARASLTTPDALAAQALQSDADNTRKKADDAYADADKLLSELQTASGAGPLAKGAKQAAQGVQVIEVYAHSAFSAAVGDQKTADDLLAQSRQLRDTALASGVKLPTLPSQIQPPPPTPTTAATTAPGTGAAAPSSTTPDGTTPAGTPATPAPTPTTPAAPTTPPAAAPTTPATPPSSSGSPTSPPASGGSPSSPGGSPSGGSPSAPPGGGSPTAPPPAAGAQNK